MRLYGFRTEDEYLDALDDARMDAAYKGYVTCPNDECGEVYDPRHHRATRTDPAYDEIDFCPACGMGDSEAREYNNDRRGTG